MSVMRTTPADAAAESRGLIALISLATVVRVGYTAVIDMHAAGNAAWMQPIGGLILCLPALLSLYLMLPKATKPDGATENVPATPAWCRWIALFAFFANFTLDASSWFDAMTESAAYTAFADVPLPLLYAPALLAASVIAAKGGNACGGLANLMLYTLPIILAITWLLQLSEMHPIWLTPLFGGGSRALLSGSFACAGSAISFPAGIWVLLLCDGNRLTAAERKKTLYALPLCILAVVVLAAVYALLSPNIPFAPHTREFELERLLSGGGTGTSVQFPLLLCLYSLLLLGGLFGVYTASRCLKAAFPALDLRLCVAISAVVCVGWTLVGFSFDELAIPVAFVRYAASTVILLLLPISARIADWRKKHARA